MRQEGRDGLCFMQDLRRALVGDSKNKRTRARAGRFLLTPGENRGTGSVGNSESIAEIFFPVSQRVERQEMERTMGHNNEVLALKKWAEGRNEFLVERFQMTMRGAEKRL